MMTKHYILQALNSNGKSVYIDEVANGKNCGCHCSECGSELVAKNKGNIKIHHFAHASGNDNIKCSQTALHLLAKEIIALEKRIPYFVNSHIEFVAVENIEQEKNLGDIKPDLYAEFNGKPIAIEIFVSHAVDEEKFNKIQNHKLTTFEIDLSKMIYESKDDVKKAIYDLKNIRPIYDELFTAQALADKQKFIDVNGRKKAIVNETIYDCPMNLEFRNMRAEMGKIKSSVCKLCPIGYKKESENIVHCIGHLNIELSKAIFMSKMKRQNITVNLDYGCQINVTKQKIVTLAELAKYFTLVTKQKFTVLKPNCNKSRKR